MRSEMEESDSPQWFGLSANVHRTVQQARSGLVIDQLSRLFVGKHASEVFDREKWNERLSPLLDLWTKLTGSRGLQEIIEHGKHGSGMRTSSDELPLDAFILMQCDLAERTYFFPESFFALKIHSERKD